MAKNIPRYKSQDLPNITIRRGFNEGGSLDEGLPAFGGRTSFRFGTQKKTRKISDFKK